MLITNFLPSKTFRSQVQNVANISISEAKPMENVDEFSVSDSDSERERRIVALESSEVKFMFLKSYL